MKKINRINRREFIRTSAIAGAALAVSGKGWGEGPEEGVARYVTKEANSRQTRSVRKETSSSCVPFRFSS